MSSMHQQQLQQMQMQRQAIANVHSSANGGGYTTVANAPTSNPALSQYSAQQLAAAAASAGLSSNAPNSVNGPQGNQSVSSPNIRAYLDQTVVPILLDGKWCDRLCSINNYYNYCHVFKNYYIVLFLFYIINYNSIGMSELVKERPSQPVQWLASYLLRHDPQNPASGKNA